LRNCALSHYSNPSSVVTTTRNPTGTMPVVAIGILLTIETQMNHGPGQALCN
jgi:hypothetical protein